MGMMNEEAITIIKNEFSKYADKLSVYAEKRKIAFDMAIKSLEQIDKIKRLFKAKMRTMTRDEFNEGFEDSTISDIKDEMWELYIFLHKIEEVLEDKAESEVEE